MEELRKLSARKAERKELRKGAIGLSKLLGQTVGQGIYVSM